MTTINPPTTIAHNILKWLSAALMLSLVVGCSDTGGEFESLVASAKAIETDGPALNVDVFYVTNRQRDERKSGGDAYSGDRGEFHVGRCGVQFTPIKILDQVASKVPFYIPSETKKVVIAEQETPTLFWERLLSSVEKNSSQSVVVFVHGYSNSFTRTCRMAAALQRFLAEQATVLMFSWPSNGLPTDYVSDQADLEWSVPLLANILDQLRDRFGASKVQLLAHSLGSRGTIFALQRLKSEQDDRPLIGQLVFLAPDFDAQTFKELLPRLAPLSTSLTLYASSHDTPLSVSHELNGYPRLGQAGEYLTVVEGMETIDVSPAGLYQILGHEYFHFHPQVAADLVTHVSTGASAAERPGLRPRERNGITYWEVLPEKTDN